MADIPFRTRVLTALTDALAEITPDNGYITNLATFNAPDGAPMARVYRGRGFFGASDPCPMVAVLEPPEDAEAVAEQPATARATPFYWRLIVQGDVPDDKENPTDPAYALLADVRRRLALERDRKDATGRLPDPLGFGGRREKNRIEELSFGAGIVRPPDEISPKAYFWLGVTLKTIEDPLFPFA